MSTSASGARRRLLDELERYYDEVPRLAARTEEIGPFTLFVQDDPDSHPFYARPQLGGEGRFTLDDVRRVRDRQRELGVPESLEWVHENTPDLVEVVRQTDLGLEENPLMVLEERLETAAPDGARTELLGPNDPRLGEVFSVINAGFEETDEVGAPRRTDDVRDRLASGTLRVVGAFDDSGALGGGSHSPRSGVTELTGIAVLPRARSRGVGAALTAALVQDAREGGTGTVFLSAGGQKVADIYARVGFVRIGTAYVAERPGKG